MIQGPVLGYQIRNRLQAHLNRSRRPERSVSGFGLFTVAGDSCDPRRATAGSALFGIHADQDIMVAGGRASNHTDDESRFLLSLPRGSMMNTETSGGIRDALDVLKRSGGIGRVLRMLLPRALTKPKVLNATTTDGGTPPSAAEVSAHLRGVYNRLRGEAYRPDGSIDYRGLAGSVLFAELRAASAELVAIGPQHLATDDERLAFWINLYNVLIVHGAIALRVETSVMEHPSFHDLVAYRVGDWVFTPDDIENGVLRRNARHPASRRRPFRGSDPRLAYCPSQVDPRIHAALVCGARSCPPIAIYEAERIGAQLDLAARGHVQANVTIDDEARAVKMPNPFKYYAADFGGRDGVKSYLIRHASEEQRSALERARTAGYAFKYWRYDWSLNDQSSR